ncbi:Dickkopf-related protein 2 [Oryzias melastigma]|uniref:Dickkopf-related protein 2 n=1 Tax=Oryzias melastigma TaxID=30732 RepID=A0A834FPT4_ORYME|nr:Dickkopf-related protein 2 [Oryzias melastigma]
MVKVDQRTLQVISISSNQTRFCCSSTVMQGLVLILGLLVLVCSPHVEPRVQLNSIRTVVLREGPAVPANRSSWESSLDLKLHQCMSDLECSEGSFCHIPATGPAHSRCRTCRRSGKRCLRDGMCCRDNRCLNSKVTSPRIPESSVEATAFSFPVFDRILSDVCVPDAAAAQSIPDADGEMKMKGWRQRKRMNIKGASSKGQVGDPCPALVRTARGGCAALATSGRASASRCCRRGRCARGSAGRATPAWSCSSAAPAAAGSAAGSCRTPACSLRPPLCCSPRRPAPNSRRRPPPSGQSQRARGCTCARRSERERSYLQKA